MFSFFVFFLFLFSQQCALHVLYLVSVSQMTFCLSFSLLFSEMEENALTAMPMATDPQASGPAAAPSAALAPWNKNPTPAPAPIPETAPCMAAMAVDVVPPGGGHGFKHWSSQAAGSSAQSALQTSFIVLTWLPPASIAAKRRQFKNWPGCPLFVTAVKVLLLLKTNSTADGKSKLLLTPKSRLYHCQFMHSASCKPVAALNPSGRHVLSIHEIKSANVCFIMYILSAMEMPIDPTMIAKK